MLQLTDLSCSIRSEATEIKQPNGFSQSQLECSWGAEYRCAAWVTLTLQVWKDPLLKLHFEPSYHSTVQYFSCTLIYPFFCLVLSGFLRPQETKSPMCPFLLGLGWRWEQRDSSVSKGVLGWPSRCHPCLGDLHQCRGEQLLFTAEPGSCWTPFRCLCAWSILPSLLLEHNYLET